MLSLQILSQMGASDSQTGSFRPTQKAQELYPLGRREAPSLARSKETSEGNETEAKSYMSQDIPCDISKAKKLVEGKKIATTAKHSEVFSES